MSHFHASRRPTDNVAAPGAAEHLPGTDGREAMSADLVSCHREDALAVRRDKSPEPQTGIVSENTAIPQAYEWLNLL